MGFVARSDDERLNRGGWDQFMAVRLRRLLVVVAGGLRSARHGRAGRGTLDAADDQCEREEKDNFSHSVSSVPPSFIRWISPFAGFHKRPCAAIVYARFR
jgi:hypothetical protein